MTKDEVFAAIFCLTVILAISAIMAVTVVLKSAKDLVTYQVISERVRDHLLPRRVTQMIPEKELRLTLNQNYASYWGWVATSDRSGQVQTQWFRVDGSMNKKNQMDYIYDIRVLIGEPALFKEGLIQTNTGKTPH